ncbi:MAG: flagellar biosynthetic protein FliO, partial [Actinomycetota bacterium]|nr:flagellar biosynthetic protein FliO [Actinomycetota bacterium]
VVMINERDRIGFASRKGLAPWIVSTGSLNLRFRLKHIVVVTILALLTAFLILSYTGVAFAEPQLTEDGGVELTVGGTVGEETAAVGAEEHEGIPKEKADAVVSSNQSDDDKTPAQPKTKSSDEFLFDAYQDPGEPQEEKGFLAGIFQTVVSAVKYIFYFALVIGVGFLAIFGVKVFTTKYNSITGGQELIHVLDIRYLAPGKAVCIVEAAGKVLVLGLAGNNINPLAEIDDFEQVEALRGLAAAKPQPLQPFQTYLEKFSGRFSRAQNKPQTKSRRPAKREPESTLSTENHWRDDLHSTGQNINQLLEEIKKQDSKRSDGTSSTNKGRGEKSR